MKLLPPPGPERWRSLGLLFAALVLVGYLVLPLLSGDAPPATAPAVRAPTTAGVPGQTGPGAINSKSAAAKKAGLDAPVPVDLAALEPPEESAPPAAGRNPFRYGEPPKPPPPPYVPPPPLPPPPPYVPPPPPVPTVKLTLVLTMLPPDGGKWVANLKDERGVQFSAVEGDVIDGRYKLIKVAEKSVVVSFLDGTGQKTLQIR